jgi:hypothetical protein
MQIKMDFLQDVLATMDFYYIFAHGWKYKAVFKSCVLKYIAQRGGLNSNYNQTQKITL